MLCKFEEVAILSEPDSLSVKHRFIEVHYASDTVLSTGHRAANDTLSVLVEFISHGLTTEHKC
jgi:hypothetical protein